ncbi:MAG TPA: hypothetical protein VFB96_17790 [Pirellulaceae bacterium]|nr:hypothetical protein [Pirellulaceae bacterium]
MEYFLIVPLAYLYFRVDERSRPPSVTQAPSFIPAAAAALGIGFVMTGIAHLSYAEFYAAILPAWLPGKVWVSWLSGWVRLAAGVAMMQPAARRVAQLVIFFLLMAMLPHSVQFASLFEFTGMSDFPWAWSRLVCHLGWLAWTLWCIVPLESPEREPALGVGLPSARYLQVN